MKRGVWRAISLLPIVLMIRYSFPRIALPPHDRVIPETDQKEVAKAAVAVKLAKEALPFFAAQTEKDFVELVPGDEKK